MRDFFFIAAACLVAGSAVAGEASYACSATSVNHLQLDGSLTADDAGDTIKGQKFTVDRASGKIVGKDIDSAGYETKVVDPGASGQSFKMLGTHSAGLVHVLYLQVQEFRDVRLKPFMLVDRSFVYSGNCE